MALLEVRTDDAEGVVYLTGELDMTSEKALESWVSKIDLNTATITLDLSEVTFMDSTGLHWLIRLARRCTVVVRDPHPNVRHVLEVTGLDERPEIWIEG